mmetsp:Transcript_9644/g.14391  ORF Transcript_9644/g.14391 Transcript_9644/m.14391 type:complete len:105 (-) Transcript_9644:2-316(-)
MEISLYSIPRNVPQLVQGMLGLIQRTIPRESISSGLETDGPLPPFQRAPFPIIQRINNDTFVLAFCTDASTKRGHQDEERRDGEGTPHCQTKVYLFFFSLFKLL